MSMMRGVRGATTVDGNTAEAILAATRELLQVMIDANGIEEADVASVIFTSTPDLNAVYPAKAARQLGWRQTSLMGCQ
ncbi:MAG: chorismate mutase, partial [Anaerolineae bacterium]|nr:chorismate mutase [Anaerolineae bacterium]